MYNHLGGIHHKRQLVLFFVCVFLFTSSLLKADNGFVLNDPSSGSVIFQIDSGGNLLAMGGVRTGQSINDLNLNLKNYYIKNNGTSVTMAIALTGGAAGLCRLNGLISTTTAISSIAGSAFYVKNGSIPVAKLDNLGNLTITGKVAPGGPTGLLVARDIQNTTITVTWTKVANATGYHVQRSTSSNMSGYANLGGTIHYDSVKAWYIDTPVDPNTVYYYRIVPLFNGTQESYPSQIVSPTQPTLPPLITTKIVSGTFPTPSHYSNMAAYILGLNGANGAQIANFSAAMLEALLVYRPNLHWDQTNDHDYREDYFFLNHQLTDRVDSYYPQAANQVGAGWSRMTYDEDGKIYYEGDNNGGEPGRSLFNRMRYRTEFFGQYHQTMSHHDRLTNLSPGIWNKMLPGLGPVSSSIRGEILTWFQRPAGSYGADYTNSPHNGQTASWIGTKSDVDGSTSITQGSLTTGTLSGTCNREDKVEYKWYQNNDYQNYGAGQLFVGGAFYRAYWRTPNGVENYMADPDQASFFQVPKATSYKPNIYKTISQGGNWWERYMYNPATHRCDVPYNNHNFTSSSLILWNKSRFTVPNFIQFGQGYLDYENHEPDQNATSISYSKADLYDVTKMKSVYIYAVSPHLGYQDEDALYLGRCRLTFYKNDGTDHVWGDWQYYKGLDLEGNPIWTIAGQTTGDKDAKSILYSKYNIALPTIIYEKKSDLYFLTTYDQDNSSFYSNVDNSFYLWAAKKPWGPWRQVFKNDYNGLQNLCAQDTRGLGGGYYTVHILPDAIDFIPGSDSDTLRLWLQAGDPFNRQIFFNRQISPTVDPNGMGVKYYRDWDEYFANNYYTLDFFRVELKLQKNVMRDTKAHAAVSFTTPDMKHEGPVDHWAIKPYSVPTAVPTPPYPDRDSYVYSFNSPTWTDDTKLGSSWYGVSFKTGNHGILISELGRYYVSGNTRTHRIKLYSGSSPKAEVSVSPFQSTPSDNKPIFDASDRVDRDGFVYAPVVGTPVYIPPNTLCHLLSQEGLTSDTISNSPPAGMWAAETCTKSGATLTTATATMTIGFRFRTGPLGLRLTHLMRMATGITTSRSLWIDQAQNNPRYDWDDPVAKFKKYTNKYYHIDPGQTIKTIYNFDESNLVTIGDTSFAYYKLAHPMDLLPSTEYFIGTQVFAGDKFYGVDPLIFPDGINRYDLMPKIKFNPNILQFIYPAYYKSPANSWNRADVTMIDAVTSQGQKYDDGIGIIPPVWGPVCFAGVVPDRFEGFRQAQTMTTSTRENYLGMPIYDATLMNKEFEVLNSVFYYTPNSDSNDLFDTPVYYPPITYNVPNSCIGPLDFKYNIENTTMTEYNMQGNNLRPMMLNNPATFAIDRSGYRNKFYNRALGSFNSGYAGMQIKVGNKRIKITKIGVYFADSTNVTKTVSIYDSRLNFTSVTCYGLATVSSMGIQGWKDATLNNTNWLEAGHTYFIFSSFNKFSGDWPYGLPDDFCNLKSGSAVQFQGPALAPNNSVGDPNMGLRRTIYLEPTQQLANPQGYGPLNFTYSLADNNHTTLTLSLYNDPTTFSCTATAWRGWRGVKIHTGIKPIAVTHLGRLRGQNNSKIHQLIIQRCDAAPLDDIDNVRSEVLTSAIVKGQDGSVGSYVYTQLEQPAILEPNTDYYMASFEDTVNTPAEQYANGGNMTTNSDFQAEVNGSSGQFQVVGAYGVDLQSSSPQAWGIISPNFTCNVNFKIQ